MTDCVFLAVHQGFQARYLLRTDILPGLKAAFASVVILTPNADEEYFRKEFQKDNVLVEMFDLAAYERYLGRSKGQGLFILLRSFVLDGCRDIRTVEDHYRLYKREHPARTWRARLRMGFIGAAVKSLRASRLLRRLFVRLENRLYVPDLHGALFEKYRPGLVVTTSLGNIGGGFDLFLMREAKRHGARIVPVILSWDNTTGKGLGGIVPDHIVAWTDIMKDELVGYHDFPPNLVSVGGIAHFDIYRRPELFLSREKLFETWALDPAKKLIFFATKSPTSYPWNAEIARMLAEAIARGEIVPSAQLLIRLHPLHYVVKKSKTREFQLFVDEFEKLERDFPFIKVDRPEILSDRLTMDMPASEQAMLASILRHSDVLVNMFSTVNIEAAILDVPLVNVVFEGGEGRRTKLRQSIDIDFHQTHNQRIVASEASRICRSPREMIEAINAYLADRSRDRERRRALAAREAGPYQGEAGRRIAGILAREGGARG